MEKVARGSTPTIPFALKSSPRETSQATDDTRSASCASREASMAEYTIDIDRASQGAAPREPSTAEYDFEMASPAPDDESAAPRPSRRRSSTHSVPTTRTEELRKSQGNLSRRSSKGAPPASRLPAPAPAPAPAPPAPPEPSHSFEPDQPLQHIGPLATFRSPRNR